MDSTLPKLIAGVAAMLMVFLVHLELVALQRRRYLLYWTVAWGCYLTRYLLMVWMPPHLAKVSLVQLAYALLFVFAMSFIWAGVHRFFQRRTPRWPLVGLFLLYFTVLPAYKLGLVSFFSSFLVAHLYIAGMLFYLAGLLFRMSGTSLLARSVAGAAFSLHALLFLAGPWLLDDAEASKWMWLMSACAEVGEALSLMVLYYQRTWEKLNQTRRELAASEEHFRRLVENMKEGLLALDDRLALTYANPGLLTLMGVGWAEVEQKPLDELLERFVPPQEKEALVNRMDALRRGEGDAFVMSVLTGKGAQRWLYVSPQAIWGRAGEFLGALAILSDFTELKQAQDNLSQALEDKDLLLKEVNHRVKNNLQTIASLLSLQAEECPGTDTARALMENHSRVMALARVHESLGPSSKAQEVDLAPYVKGLARGLAQAYQEREGEFALSIECPDMAIPVDRAAPLGLVLTEILTNSFKYAFPSGAGGVIVIRCDRVDELLRLTVIDDGKGLPDGMDPRRDGGLGMALVRGLVENQMGGRVHWRNQGGLAVIIETPLEPA